MDINYFTIEIFGKHTDENGDLYFSIGAADLGFQECKQTGLEKVEDFLTAQLATFAKSCQLDVNNISIVSKEEYIAATTVKQENSSNDPWDVYGLED